MAFGQLEGELILRVVEQAGARPRTTGCRKSRSSSTSPALSSERSRVALPLSVMSSPFSRLSRETASLTSSVRTVVFCHLGDSSVADATYFLVLFIQSPFWTSLPR
jgi:hypothetical protein